MPDDTPSQLSNFTFTMTTPRAIKSSPDRHGSIARSPFSSSYLSSSPIAQESIARDLAECSDDEEDAEEPDSPSEDESEASTIREAGHQDAASHSMASSYRRPSFVAFGGTRPAVAGMGQKSTAEPKWLTRKEKKQSRNEERSLLRDNHLGELWALLKYPIHLDEWDPLAHGIFLNVPALWPKFAPWSQIRLDS